MAEFAELLANNGISVLTYDKRGVGKSGGVYAGPEVGTNNVDSLNINLLAKDARAALNKIKNYSNGTPIGLLGFSQAGWIIPIAANNNPLVNFMVLFSCPTITSLEQLRFQFYTNGNTNFWVNHTEEDARNHIKNDSDRYQFISTDPKVALRNISAPSLWLFGEKDIQIPVKLCIEQINTLKSEGKPFEYTLFSNLGHNTTFTDDKSPVEIAINWIKEKTKNFKP
jgi:pimeloyl-ACP methyl ester carboxylesterase